MVKILYSENMHEYKNTKKGFVALMSVIILSAILLIIVMTLSTSSFFKRYEILGSELKERSLSNAEACVDEGLLIIANNESHNSTTTTILSSLDSCTLSPIPNSGNPKIFYATSNMRNYVTNIKVTVDPSTVSVISWEEIPTY